MLAGLLLALLTSALYGTTNFLLPFFARRHTPSAVLLYGQSTAAVLSLGCLAVSGEAVPDLRTFALSAVVGVSNAIGLIGLLQATRYGPLAVVAPLNASGAAAPAVVGLAGGDAATPTRLGGLVLSLAGAVLVARSANAGTAAARPGWAMRRCIGWAVVSATGFGLLLVLLPVAMEDSRWWSLLTLRIVMVACVVAMITLGRQTIGPRPTLRQLGGLALPGVFVLAGTIAYGFAATLADLSVVGVAGSLSAPVTVALAFAFLHERPTRSQFAGAVAATVGVGLLALST